MTGLLRSTIAPEGQPIEGTPGFQAGSRKYTATIHKLPTISHHGTPIPFAYAQTVAGETYLKLQSQ